QAQVAPLERSDAAPIGVPATVAAYSSAPISVAASSNEAGARLSLSEDRRLGLWSRIGRHASAGFEIARPFSFTASTAPVAAAGALAPFNGKFDWLLFLAAFVAAVMLHIGTNVTNEIYD